ncbi:MAG: tyrosine-type recombinase/integrase [Nitrosomonas sp.]|nr:tyrosine-type recombinase/integrase [Nitrosomonas sp.]
MIARRKTNLHLPPRMYLYEGKRRKTYYTITAANERINLGHDLAAAKRKLLEIEEGRPVAGTINELIDRYIKEVSPKKAARTHKDEISSARLLNNVFGKMKPADLRPMHVAKYLDMRGKTAPVRANREKALLSHMFSMAMRWGIVDSNPCRGVARNTETPRDRFVTDAELKNFIDYAESLGETGQLMARTAWLAYLTGQRRGDLLKLRLDMLTDEGILIRQSKNGARVIIEWTSALHDCVSSLRALPRPVSGMFLICNRSGQTYTDSGFKAMWGRIMTAWSGLGNERFHFHDLRAKAITKMVDDGRQARDLSGHQTDAMVDKVYDRRKIKRSKAVE